MLDFINQITDKPRWWEKIQDQEILSRWREEACGSDEQQRTSDQHLNKQCFEHCLLELQDKAQYLERHGVIHVLDVHATIVKSDANPSDPLQCALREAVRSLEDVPDRLKDWHPGSDNLVLDLLHPSLFPLHYGHSRVLADCIVPFQDCAVHSGRGEICSVPTAITEDKHTDRSISWGNSGNLKPWGSYQWLPAEVLCGEDGSAHITSYVNKLQPTVHTELYSVLEQAVTRAIPLWNECLSWFHDRMRIKVDGCGYDDFVAPTYPGHQPQNTGSDGPRSDDEEDENEMSSELPGRPRPDSESDYRDWLQAHPDERLLLQPSPSQDLVQFERKLEQQNLDRIDLRTDFPGGLQVIFKLANIHLTLEQPRYEGSNWHVEGVLNEHICVTALFYYDAENIEDNFLEFRQHIDAEAMVMKPAQFEYEAAEQLYGIQNEEAAV